MHLRILPGTSVYRGHRPADTAMTPHAAAFCSPFMSSHKLIGMGTTGGVRSSRTLPSVSLQQSPALFMVMNEPMTRSSGRGFVWSLGSMLTFSCWGKVLSRPLLKPAPIEPPSPSVKKGGRWGNSGNPAASWSTSLSRLYVADTYNHRIQVFAQDGRFSRTFGTEGSQRGALLRPKGMAWGPNDLLYVADTGNHRIQAFDQPGKVRLTLGSFGTQPSQFNAPEGIAVDTEQRLYIADTQNHRVQKLAPDGRFLLSWGGSGSGKGEFLGPSDMALDREGRVSSLIPRIIAYKSFTAMASISGRSVKPGAAPPSSTVPGASPPTTRGTSMSPIPAMAECRSFDRAGRYLTQVGHLGKGSGEFYSPAALWIDPQQTLYVADTINHRVQILSLFPRAGPARARMASVQSSAARYGLARVG